MYTHTVMFVRVKYAHPNNRTPTRMIFRYSSTWAAFKQIYRDEGGVRALYRGTLPTVQRAAILTATQLGTYDHIKHFIMDDMVRKRACYRPSNKVLVLMFVMFVTGDETCTN